MAETIRATETERGIAERRDLKEEGRKALCVVRAGETKRTRPRVSKRGWIQDRRRIDRKKRTFWDWEERRTRERGIDSCVPRNCQPRLCIKSSSFDHSLWLQGVDTLQDKCHARQHIGDSQSDHQRAKNVEHSWGWGSGWSKGATKRRRKRGRWQGEGV